MLYYMVVLHGDILFLGLASNPYKSRKTCRKLVSTKICVFLENLPMNAENLMQFGFQ